MNQPVRKKFRTVKAISFAIAALSLMMASACSCNGFPIPDLPEKVIGHCIYKNGFSGMEECKEYLGDWKKEDAVNDCSRNNSQIVLDQKCGIADDKRFGECIFIVDKDNNKYARVELPGTDDSRCGSVERGCEFFGGGAFVPTKVCGGKTGGDVTPGGLPVFRPGEYFCREPLKGEPPGKGPDGKVCTYSAISGATEPGRAYEEYGNCDLVRTQRPYYPVPPEKGHDKEDPRMKDPAYVKENNWVRDQVKATACMCCHTTSAPQGPSNWYIESKPNWINSMSDKALAMGAGWMNGVGFGAYPSDKNNGFTRPTPKDPYHTIFTTTNNERMKKFFENELKHRGKTRDDFKGEVYAAGPMDTQRLYKPTECKGGEMIKADGTIVWGGSPARYIQVLKAGSNSPGVPPNLDIPEGTVWKLDVDYKDGTPIKSGEIKFGEVPENTRQAFPKEGKPAKLEPGQKYYLYVMIDIANPVARCIFTMPK